MRNLIVTCFLFMVACAAEPMSERYYVPQAGSVVVEDLAQAQTTGTLTYPLQGASTTLEGWTVPARLPSDIRCVGRPENEKLLSPNYCPTCPLLWVYPVGSTAYLTDVNAAADQWNNEVGFYVVGVDQYPPSRAQDVPTYGTVVNINTSTYDPPTSSGSSYVAGINSRVWYRCDRDAIFINLDLPSFLNTAENRRRTIAHEIGHSLVRTANVWHSALDFSIMYTHNKPGQYVPGDLKQFLYTIRQQVMSGNKTLPCALRGKECQ